MLPWRQDEEMGPSNPLHDANKEIKRFYASGAKSPEPGAFAIVPKCHFVNLGLANRYLSNKRLGPHVGDLPNVFPNIDF